MRERTVADEPWNQKLVTSSATLVIEELRKTAREATRNAY